jgi:uracil phosphoribosyltransferase
MVDAIQRLIPAAKVGHIGLLPRPRLARARALLRQAPGDIGERRIFVLDPMLATGGAPPRPSASSRSAAPRASACSTSSRRPSVSRVEEAHPDVDIVVAALDSHLNDHGYIVPGLGDAGDRIYGTK